jgi:hypothetical protein
MKAKTTNRSVSASGNKLVRVGDTAMVECKSQILLRSVPCEVVQVINRKKIEIMNNNPNRTTVSHSEAIFKLILTK